MPAVIRYSPFSLLQDIQNDINQVFDRSTEQWPVRVDIIEENDKYLVVADVPGVDPKEIQLSIEGNTLSIKGERKAEEHKEEKEHTRIERLFGSFHRQFTLPDNVDPNKIEAASEHGVLKLIIHKKESTQPKRIEVKVESKDS